MATQINTQNSWIYTPDTSGKTPLDQAALEQNEFQTNLHLKQLFGDQASFHFNATVLKPLREQYSLLESSIQEHSQISPAFAPPLHKAAFQGNLDEIKKTQFPEKLQIKDSKGLTPLHYAILGKQKDTVSYLLEQADLSYTTLNGDSYLHYAAMSGDFEILSLFLGKVDASYLNAKKYSAAHIWAASSTDLKALKEIFHAGAPLQSSSVFGLSPVGVLVLKAMDKYQAPVKAADLALVFINILRLFQMTQMSRLSRNPSSLFTETNHCTSGNFNHFNTYAFGRNVLGLLKRMVIQNMVPPEQRNIRTSLASPLAGLATRGIDWAMKTPGSFPGRIPIFSTVSSTAAAVIVAKNAKKSLERCKTASMAQKILATTVHAFNTGCAFFDALLTFDPSIVYSRSFMRCFEQNDNHGDRDRFYREKKQKRNDSDPFEDFFDNHDGGSGGEPTFQSFEFNANTGKFEETTGGGQKFEDSTGDTHQQEGEDSTGGTHQQEGFEDFEDIFRRFFNGGGGSSGGYSGGGTAQPSAVNSCVDVSASSYTSKSLIDRLFDPTLTQDLDKTVKDIFGNVHIDPICLKNYAIALDPENPPTNCKTATKAYNKASLTAHPDKITLYPELLTELKKRCDTKMEEMKKNGEKPMSASECEEILKIDIFRKLTDLKEKFCQK